MSKAIDMGAYYISAEQGLVRTVCRAKGYTTEDTYIVYMPVDDGGCVSEVLLIDEDSFEEEFLHQKGR